MSQLEIIGLLNTLGIKHENHPNSKGWLNIICPDHMDHEFGNASINIISGKYHCFKCGSKGHIDQLWKKRFNIIPDNKFEQVISEPVKEVKVNRHITDNKYNFIHTELKPDKYNYTLQRGFTKEFIDYFGIRHALSDIYSDYLIIPIIDKEKNIVEIEARKLKEYETLKSYFDLDLHFDRLKRQFKKHIKDNNIHMTKYKLSFNNEIIEDDNLFYLLDKKVKYCTGSRINETLFNIDYLDRNEPLYLVEGLGSIPKIWSYVSKNCTCTFGSNVSDYQIEYLKQFKTVYLIPDFDLAGYKMAKKLYYSLDNLYIIDIKDFDDTDENYVNLLLTKPLTDTLEYLNSYKYEFNTNKK